MTAIESQILRIKKSFIHVLSTAMFYDININIAVYFKSKWQDPNKMAYTLSLVAKDHGDIPQNIQIGIKDQLWSKAMVGEERVGRGLI